LEFELADFLFTRNQMLAKQIDFLLTIWGTSLLQHGGQPLFASHDDLYKTIDSMPLGDVKWQSFSIKYTSDQPFSNVPLWMDDTYKTWFRDPHKLVHMMLENPDFTDQMTFVLIVSLRWQLTNVASTISCLVIGLGSKW
ncbi:hypothetical protein PAXRUDRAFT_157421, partial [Paxillus rubicundulus Ve08.2h10]